MDRDIQAILTAPPRQVVEKQIDILVAITKVFPVQYKQLWFGQAFLKVPGDVLTEEDKQKLHDQIIKPEIKESRLLDSFEMFAKRARNSLNRGGAQDEEDDD